MSPTEEYDSEDATSVGTDRSTRSDAPKREEGEWVLATYQHCRAIFEVEDKQSLKPISFVCLGQVKGKNGTSCRRTGHKEITRKAPPGCSYQVQRSGRIYLDGLLTSQKTSSEVEAEKRQERQDVKAAMSSFGASVLSGKGWEDEEAEPFKASSISFGPTDVKPPPSGASVDSPKASVKIHKMLVKEGTPSTLASSTEKEGTLPPEAQLAAQLQALGPAGIASFLQQLSSASSPPEALSTPKKERKKAGRRKTRGKKTRRRQRNRSPSDSDPSDSSSSSSNDSRTSGPRDSPPPSPNRVGAAGWWALFQGAQSMCEVFQSEAEAKRERTRESVLRPFPSSEEAWAWLDKMLAGMQKAGPPPPVQERVFPTPPALLQGRDPATKDKNKLFDVDLNVSTPKLMEVLSPPGISSEMAESLSDSMIDAVSLPGKINHSSEGDDTAEVISMSLLELSNQGRRGDGVRRDFKWQSPGRNALSGVKSSGDLLDHLEEVGSIEDEVNEKMVGMMRTILSSLGWADIYVDAWSVSGYLPTIFRKTLSLYRSLLEHLKRTAEDYGWENAKLEVAYYTSKMGHVRNLANARITALCRMYVFLRDHSETSWSAPKIEAKKLSNLYLKMDQLTVHQTISPPPGGNKDYCKHCCTGLHGGQNCPWSAVGRNKAKLAGTAVLKWMAAGGDLAKGVAAVGDIGDEGPKEKKSG